ncbi:MULTISPECIES: hypothetical protein [Streptomyces]|uniref:Secreted protein n=1 Tax=Streptomyces albus (strain ATCC 21838 / DSM 41398 / FERM P-419 / JCM 4703 / NBRC 107858) TaxID=1081613 RepID=A0A0B5F5F6_STRA4|nr:hypothetical protein [Streptomyces sp. SCSIO ZS0520]AJE85597.1 hypothetical protein SLNWT_5221 [Streptomyces albus]AOU79900.1 hypothetical protein SLNHY_5209 [Streptomyces albus]
MTHPPNGSAAPPVPAPPAMPAVPPQQAPAGPPGAAPGTPPPGPGRRTAWAEGVERLRAAATTEPGRLRIIGAVLALLVVVFGAVTAWETSARSAAADDVLHRSQRLSSDAADIYRSLADANTAASSGFLAGGQEPAAVRERYDRDIERASEKLARAASSSGADSGSADAIAELNQLLPQYTGLIERARANNREGLPLGGAYLRYANDRMQREMLPAAEKLYTSENERLRGDYDDATPYPWLSLALGVLALGALGWAQHRNYRHTNRVFNHGLLAATAAATVAVLWLAVGHSVARSGLDDSYDGGVRSLKVLNDARIAALKARGNENLTLVSRGAETVTVKDRSQDKFDFDYQKQIKSLGGAESGLLGEAARLADDKDGDEPVAKAVDGLRAWTERHTLARERDDTGDYEGALEKVIGADDKDPTGESFDQVDRALGEAVAHEQRQFTGAAEDGRGAMTGLTVGIALLAVLGAAAAVLGIGRRLSEYR